MQRLLSYLKNILVGFGIMLLAIFAGLLGFVISLTGPSNYRFYLANFLNGAIKLLHIDPEN